MKRKIYALDLGSKSFKIGVGEEDETGKINLLAKFTKPTISFSDGEIIDPESFETELVDSLKEITYQVGEEPREILLSFSSSHFFFQRSKGKISVSEKKINEQDIKRCLSLAKISLVSSGLEIIYEEPFGFFLDGSNIKIRDPLGMEAHNLEVDLLVIQTYHHLLNKIKNFFNENNLKISLILPNPLPASYVVLNKREKELGVILIDFGYRIFNVSVFQEGKLIEFKSFKFGLGEIVEDLAIDLSLEVKETEDALQNLKKEDMPRKGKIKFCKKVFTFSNFYKLLEKKINFYWKKNNLNEFFKTIKTNFRIPMGVYLMGGGSFLPEAENLFKKFTGFSTKLSCDITGSLSSEERIYYNILGLLFYYQKKTSIKTLWDNFKDIFEGFRRIIKGS